MATTGIEGQAQTPSDVDLDIDLDATLDAPTTVEKIVSLEEIRHMITQLSVTEEGEPLKGAMRELKKAILENASACTVLLPAEIGEMVKYLYKTTDRDLQAAIDKASKSKSKKKATGPKIDFSDPNVQQEILDDL